MKIELDKKQVDEVARQTIGALEKKVKSLERKLETRDRTIVNMKERQNFSKGIRAEVLSLAEALVSNLEDSEWVQYDRHEVW